MFEDLLLTIKDDVVWNDDLADNDYALYQLFVSYSEEQNTENSKVLNEGATGAELKEALAELPLENRFSLLKDYLDAKNSKSDNKKSNEDENENTVVKQIWGDVILRRWVVKAVIYFVFAMIFAVIGAVIGLGVLNGTISDGMFVNTILNTAFEILKLIFGAD